MNELIEKLKAKDEWALKEVMKMYKGQIFNYLLLMLGNREQAEELTQDTFVRVYFKAGSLRTENLKAWIYKIATNLALSHFRKKRIKNLFSLGDVNEINYSYDQKLGDNIIIEEALTLLPEKYRIPLIMKEVDNFSFEEMSDILQKPVGTLKSLVFRGKEKMRSKLEVQLGGNNG
ncbi:MAG: RNA polymerase sigma factor [Candidatus Aminicenantes bacterium]|nr:RNA polymerase sigma factor [Candidatus Aminicenantes bacterium]